MSYRLEPPKALTGQWTRSDFASAHGESWNRCDAACKGQLKFEGNERHLVYALKHWAPAVVRPLVDCKAGKVPKEREQRVLD